jgi:magnesium-protoporphyrin O-methyltransferase
MATSSYIQRRGQIETYFDRTAVEAWERLTSDAPVSRIRATVRAGRDETRRTLLDWLPADLTGRRVLDAGCGTGLLAIEAACRGADVLAVDLSANLVSIARDRAPHDLGPGRLTFLAGDMLDPELGTFDHVVGMDSLIHYEPKDVARTLGSLASRTRASIVFTFAPATILLSSMLSLGRLFPRADRSPAIKPASLGTLSRLISAEPDLRDWHIARTKRISSGFYISQSLEIIRS